MSWSQRLFRWLKRSAQTAESGVFQPILSAEHIQALGNEVKQLQQSPAANKKDSEARKQGEQNSRYLGSGMEYAESRLYQAGDEVRGINWRLMARTGEAYTKLFQEERQESWTLLVDQRQSMRFGTKTHLKVTQAARLAGYFAWQAQTLGLPISVIVLSDDVKQSQRFEGQGSFERVMEFISLPCPPLEGIAEPALYDELLACQNQLQGGARLIVISDFHDLAPETIQLMTALQSKLLLQAVLISDPVEKHLPRIQGLSLKGISGDLDPAELSLEQLQAYADWADNYFAEKTKQLARANVMCAQVSTADSLAEAVHGLAGGFSHG